MPRILKLNRQTNGEPNPVTWVDLDLRESDSRDWIERKSGLSAEVVRHLLEVDELSRRETYDDGMLICFHTRKIRPVAGETDSLTQRIWIDKDRIITVRSEWHPAIDALLSAAEDDTSNWEPYQVLAFLIRASVRRFEPLINDMFATTTKLEDQFLDTENEFDEDELNEVRRQTMRSRRHFVMLRNLLAFVAADEALPISPHESQALDSARRQVLGYLESLDECNERAQLLQDQVRSRMADRLNQITYNLTIVATVFMPLSFLTGLMGMSVAGIPDSHSPYAFTIICLVMVIIAVFSWLFLRWRRWI